MLLITVAYWNKAKHKCTRVELDHVNVFLESSQRAAYLTLLEALDFGISRPPNGVVGSEVGHGVRASLASVRASLARVRATIATCLKKEICNKSLEIEGGTTQLKNEFGTHCWKTVSDTNRFKKNELGTNHLKM